MRIKFVLIFSIVFASLSNLFSQKYEIGGGLGVLNYKGDLNPVFRPQMVSPGLHIFGRVNSGKAMTIKVGATIGELKGDDTKSSNPLNQKRGYSFKSRVFEWSGIIEYNFFDFRKSIGVNYYNWTPYFFAGIGQFNVSKREFTNTNAAPTTVFNTTKLGSKLMIPYGIGFKLKLNRNFNLGFEAGARQILGSKRSDLLDGFGYNENDKIISLYPASQSFEEIETIPNTIKKDLYFYSSFSISYVFHYVKCP